MVGDGRQRYGYSCTFADDHRTCIVSFTRDNIRYFFFWYDRPCDQLYSLQAKFHPTARNRNSRPPPPMYVSLSSVMGVDWCEFLFINWVAFQGGKRDAMANYLKSTC